MAKFVKKQTKEVLQDLFGAWKYVESLGKGKYEFQIKTLYYLKDAEAYWVVEFFKDEVKIGNKIYPFKLKDGKLLIEIEANNTAVFEKVDSIIRTKDDIATKDDINIPFVEDKNVLGVWKCIDLVDNEKQFNPNSKYYEHYMMWDKFVFSPNGELMVVFEDKGTNNIKYTKGIIINEMFQNTATAYKVKKIDGKQYMFKEHKSGDYVWGKMKPYLYVFKKEV